MLSETTPANLIRQWCYCPRKVYYFELTDFPVHYPQWVNQGENFHAMEEKLWKRRNLSRFSLQRGRKHHNLNMHSEKLAMHGIADMVIETKEEIFPIEFKLSASNKKRGDILQLVAYGMLAQDKLNKPVKTCFLVGKGKVLHQIDCTDLLKEEVTKTVTLIRQMLNKGLKPDSSASIHQCSACEYINHCNDR